MNNEKYSSSLGSSATSKVYLSLRMTFEFLGKPVSNGLMPVVQGIGLVAAAGFPLQGNTLENRSEATRPVIDEVIVTAKRREESAQDLGMALTVFSGDRLQSMGIVDTADLAKQVPGFSFSQERRGTPIFTLRGVGFNDASAAAQSPVGVYVDEVSLPYSVMSKGANIDIQRVEVLKGPQGTLYGRSTTAGAINYITKKPTQEFEAGITATYARFDKKDLEAFVTGGTDAVQGRLAFRRIRSNEGWQTNQIFPGERFGEDDKWFGRASVNWDVFERWNVVLTYSGWEDQSDGQMPQNHFRFTQATIPGFMPSEDAQSHPTITEEDSRLTAWHPNRDYGTVQERGRFYGIDQRFGNVTARIAWHLTEMTEIAITVANQRFKDRSAYNTDGLAVEIDETLQNADTEATSIELKMSGSWDAPSLNWTAGYYNYTDSVDEIFIDGLRDASGGNAGTAFEEGTLSSDQDQDSQALFAQVDWQAHTALKLTLGARYTEYRRELAACGRGDEGLARVFTALQLLESGDPDGPGPGECFTLNEEGKSALVTRKLEEDNVAGRSVVEWTPFDDFLVYGSYSRGFKSGGFPLFPSARAEQFDPVTQEELRAYELGIKSQWFENSLMVNSTAFYYDYRDKQLQSFFNDEVFGLLLKLENIPEVRNTGMELEASYTPLRDLLFSLSAIYLDAKVRKFTGLNSEGDRQDFAGKTINDAPQWEATARVDYEIPLRDLSGWTVIEDTRISFSADMSYSSESFGFLDNDPNFVTRPHRVVNARVSLKSSSDAWSVMLWGKNITNEFYTQGFGKITDVGFRFTGMPQTYGVTFQYRL